MILQPDDILKLLLAVLIGGVIGAEREFRDKSAGFRTLIFICVGACLFTIGSIEMGGPGDPVRIAAQIVSGIGFLGAGAILRDGLKITGLTTAATIWLVAALGMAVGGGLYALAGAVTVTVLIVLWIFPRLEGIIDASRETHVYEITCARREGKIEELERLFRECDLHATLHRQVKNNGDMTVAWHIFGRPIAHVRLTKALFDDPEVRSFRY
jgi:putative Mg2+ transporter-C (MgtC) family protein